ncbi:MAG: Fe-S cluster assembly protein SufB, partial [Nitrosopumilus sp.]
MYVHLSKKGLSRDTVIEISKLKDEPQWMLDFRLRSYEIFMKKPMPTWGGDLSAIDFQNIYYYMRATEKVEKNWDDVPENVKNTFEKLGIPEAEKKFLAGVGAQYESEVVYHSLREDLAKQG